MSGYLKQSTASQVRTIGVFVDDTDFKTLKNALTIANTDIIIKKNGASSAAKNSGGATADGAGGLYHLTWDATDTATVGELMYSVKVAGALVVFGSYTVLEEAVYDALFGASAAGYQVPIWAAANSTVNLSGTTIKAVTDRVTANVDQLGGDAQSLIDLKRFADFGYDPINDSIFTVVTAQFIGVDGISSLSIEDDAIAANKIAAGALNGKGDWNIGKTGYSLLQAFPANFSSLAIAALSGAVTVGTNNDKTGYSLTQAFPTNFASLGINASGHVSRVTLADTLTTYTGNTLQTGDAFGVVNSGTFGNSALKTLIDAIATAVSNVPSATDNADGLLDLVDGVETGRTVREALRGLIAAELGKLSGAATTNVLIRDTNDSKNRINATVDASGNRTAVTLDLS